MSGKAVKAGGAVRGEVPKWLSGHVNFSGDECLIFPFARNPKGYGCIAHKRFRSAHRWMCFHAHGEPPAGKPWALHKCGRGGDGCVNPKHLYWGNGVDNYDDQIAHGVAAIGTRHGMSVLAESDVREIRRLASNGENLRSIVSELGWSRDAVRSVLNGVSWRWLA
jgi:hypothetical protein